MTPDHSPLRRPRAASYLLLVLLGFGAAVVLTRLYLDLTGYPQLGGGELHIAHVLWGGLLLLAGALLVLVLANRWALSASALLIGVGVGLFIDEVGKFITQRTDYFHPLAAPIIYAAFLLLALMLLALRERREVGARGRLYALLDALADVADQDLDAPTRAAMRADIAALSAGGAPEPYERLARALADFLAAAPPPAEAAHWERTARGARLRGRGWLRRQASRRRLKVLVGLGFLAMSLVALLNLLALVGLALAGRQWVDIALSITSGKHTYTVSSPEWLYVGLAINAVSGLLALSGLLLMAAGRPRRGLGLGIAGLLLALTLGNLVAFYFSQFYTVLDALLQLLVLAAAMTYRRRFTRPGEARRVA